jgi:hypothetical protein
MLRVMHNFSIMYSNHHIMIKYRFQIMKKKSKLILRLERKIEEEEEKKKKKNLQ